MSLTPMAHTDRGRSYASVFSLQLVLKSCLLNFAARLSSCLLIGKAEKLVSIDAKARCVSASVRFFDKIRDLDIISLLKNSARPIVMLLS